MEIDRSVRVKVLFFAQSRELAGKKESFIILPKKINHRQLLNAITDQFNLHKLKNNILLALNEEVCDESIDLEISERDSRDPTTERWIAMDHLLLTFDKLSVESISDLVTDDSCGAVSIFVGTTRDNFEGKKVLRLEYESYESMALKSMKCICDEVRAKWTDVYGIAMYHRLGEVPTREASVVIAVSSPHRQDSLQAVSYCIDALKARVPIWKKEVYETGDATWKENKECKPVQDEVSRDLADFDSNLVQINVSCEEMERRMQNFINRKREQINMSNVQDFIPSLNQDGDNEETCARVRTQFVKRKDSKGHLKIHKVHNEWGPQISRGTDPVLPDSKSDLPTSISERVQTLERCLNVRPVSKDIYERLKVMEDKLEELQAISPEYKQFWQKPTFTSSCPTQSFKETIFTAEDIAKKITLMENM